MKLQGQRLEISPDVHARQFDDELVILDLASGHYFGLNEVGAAFWARATQGESVDEAVNHLSARYDVERVRLEADIDTLVDDLLSRKLLRRRI